MGLSQRTSRESNPSDPFTELTSLAPLSPSPDPPIHEIILCDADVLAVIDHPLLSRGPESDLLGAFVRGKKIKNLNASSSWPEIRRAQSHLSLERWKSNHWKNNPNNNKKISIRKYSPSRDLKDTSHFSHPTDMIPPLGKKNKCVCKRRRGREESRDGKVNRGREEGQDAGKR